MLNMAPVIRVIKPITITRQILITLRQIFRRPVLNVIQRQAGLHPLGIMTVNIFLFIQAGITEDGIPVRIVIQIRLIMHRILVMLYAIKAIIIRTRIVTHVIQQEMREGKE